jgi:type II secretory pathway component GspD/PulD (secretin)
MSRSPIALCLVLVLSACASTAAPAEPSDFAVVPLEHAAAHEVAAQLTSLLRDRDTLRVVLDQRTNSVVLIGSTDELAEAQAIVEELDRPAPGT